VEPGYLFLIGAPKCGTTSVAAWLGRFPEVSVASAKEPAHFTDFAEIDWTGPGVRIFDRPWTGDRAAWEGLFADEGTAAWRVDASTDYLWCPASPDLIAAFAGTARVKVAVILRDPVERALSEYQHTLRDGFTTDPLREALAREEERKAKRMHPLFYHVTRSRYRDAVHRYHELFGDDLLILDYHRLGDGELDRLAGHLDLPDLPQDDFETRNQGFVHRHPRLRTLMRNPAALRVSRKIVPKPLRASVRGMVESLARSRYRPSATDIENLRSRLADEIRACRKDPLIPTGNWTLAKPPSPDSPSTGKD
jgi:hypothetical protein